MSYLTMVRDMIMKKPFLLFFALPIVAVAGEVSVTSVTAQQRYPWNGLVDVTVTIQGTAEDMSGSRWSFAAMNNATKAIIPVEHIKRNGMDLGAGNAWTRKFVWDAKADVGAVKIDDVAFTVDVETDYGGVQLWENGPYWAECNVGATNPEECGYYFYWGDTVGYKRKGGVWTAGYYYSGVTWESSAGEVMISSPFSSSSCPTYGKDSPQLQSEGYIDSTGNLVAAHDAATVHLGAPWRMPTNADFTDLERTCDTVWTKRNGVNGRLVTGRGAYSSRSIFLPASGSGSDGFFYPSSYSRGSYGGYWLSTDSWHMFIDSDYFSRERYDRYIGQAVRPIRGFAGTAWRVLTHFVLDCRSVQVVDGSHPIIFDASWYSGGVLAKITDNGQEIVSGTRGTYTWGATSDDVHLLTLNVYNAEGDVVGTESTWYLSREDLTELVIPDGTREIGAFAFEGGKFVSVKIPNGVTNVSPSAFAGCSNIVAVTVLPWINVASIFADSKDKIAQVTLMAGTDVPASSYSGCSSLVRVDVESLSDWLSLRFGNAEANPLHTGAALYIGGVELTELLIPDGMTKMHYYAFNGCGGLRRVEIPSALVSSEYGAFSGCERIRSVEFESFPNANFLYTGPIEQPLINGLYPRIAIQVEAGVEAKQSSLELRGPCNYTFNWRHKNSLTFPPLPFTVEENFAVYLDGNVMSAIDDFEWQECSITIPDGVHTVKWRHQNATSMLEYLNDGRIDFMPIWQYGPKYPGEVAVPYRAAACLFPDSFDRIEYVECGADIPDWYFSSCSGIVTCVVKDGVSSIGDGAFHNCKVLRAFAVPDSVLRVGEYAFRGCESLMFFDIGHGVESIGNNAWMDCINLQEIKFPNSVRSVGDSLFKNCHELKKVVFAGAPPENLFAALDGIDEVTVVCREKYKQEFLRVVPECVDVRTSAEYVQFDPPDGTCFESALKVVATSDLEDAEVHYTTDGTDPSVDSPLFKKLTITEKTTIKAIVVRDGEVIGAISTATYGTGRVRAPVITSDRGCLIDNKGVIVEISCSTPKAEIKYTLDGSDPRMFGLDYNGSFRLFDSAIVRAIAVAQQDFVDSDEAVASFRRVWERLDAPLCSMNDGETFYHSNQKVELTVEFEGAEIHYTLDGSEPTEESQVYTGHLLISDTTTIRFAAFKDGFLPSETKTVDLIREWLIVSDPVISAPESFTGKRTVVTIASATEGAHIYYTTDGSTPTTASKVYSGPIEIHGTTTIRAIAVKEDWLNSGIVSATVEKVWSIGDALNLSGWPFTCSGSEPWTVCRSESYDGEASMRSGDIMRNETSELQMQVAGSGTLSFWWKASCEWTGSPDVLLYDAGEFFVDGIRRSYIQGFADWVKVEVSVDGTGPHEFVWRYSKDGSDSEGEDCVWLDCVSWTGSPKIEDAVVPSSIAGGNEDLTVNGSWVTTDLVERYGKGKDIAFCEMYGSDLSAALLKPTGKKDASGNPLFVWQDYVAGTDPTDPNSLFRVSVEMVDGRPVITWEPNLNENDVCRVYTIYGKYELSDAKWHTPTNGLSRFFKVGVSMPGLGGSTGEEDPQDGEEGLLLHRWSFNGNLLDSVGGSDAAVGGSVFQGEKEYTLRGGASGSSYIDLGDDLFPTDGSAVTMEIWATCRSASPGWTRIWQFGDMPQGYDFSSYNTSMYSENYIGMCWNGKSKFSSDDGEWDNYSWTSFTRFNEAYLSVVYAPNGDGSWTVSYRHIDVMSGETIGQHSFSTKGSDWSLASVGQSECLLGQALTCWDDCANASYNEVRIWNRALSEAEQKAHVAAGPDASLTK